MTRWSPLLLNARRWSFSLILRIPWPLFHPLARIKLEAILREYGDWSPRITITAGIWRMAVGARIGGFWRDEDGDESSLADAWLSFSTYGLPNLVCLALGHRPDDYEYRDGRHSCERCHAFPLPISGAAEEDA